jgi:hypothetical protein
MSNRRTAGELVPFHATWCSAWAAVSRRSLNVIQGISWPATTGHPFAHIVESRAEAARIPEGVSGFDALYYAMRSAKWVISNSDSARDALVSAIANRGGSLEAFDHYLEMLKTLRDRLTHIDRDVLEGSTLGVYVHPDALRLHFLRDGEDDWWEFGYGEWDHWLTVLEEWRQDAESEAVLDSDKEGAARRVPHRRRDHRQGVGPQRAENYPGHPTRQVLCRQPNGRVVDSASLP